MAAKSPGEQKALGRKVKNFNQAIWEECGVREMKIGIRNKFLQNIDLKIALFETIGTILIEAGPWDCKWGIGLSASDPRTLDPSQWRGQNLLGEILMEVREELYFEVEIVECEYYYYFEKARWSEDTKESDKKWQLYLGCSPTEFLSENGWMSNKDCERAYKFAKYLCDNDVCISKK